MADKMTAEQRHRCMSNIKSKNTKPEMIVRRWLWHEGYRYRLNVKQLPGRPDIVLPKYSTVIFVNGCFWHAHEGCDKYRLPYVLVVWECQLEKSRRHDTLLALSRRLSQIYLDTHNARLYTPSLDEEATIQQAAEPLVPYGE